MVPEGNSMKIILYAVFFAALMHSGFSSTSLAQDKSPANDAGQQADIEQNVNDMVRLLEELQNDEEMSSELLLQNNGSDGLVLPEKEIINSAEQPPPEQLVKPDEKLVPIPSPVEKNSAKNSIEPANNVVELDTDFPESSVQFSDRSPADNAGKKEDVEQNVNDMVRLLEDMQIQGLLFPKDEGKKTEKPDPLQQFVKPEKNLIPIPAPVEKRKAKNYIEPANEVVRFDPDGPDSHFQLGLENWVSKNLDEAIRQFQEVVRLDPENAHAYWNLGLLYDENNRGPEAIANIKKAEDIYAKYEYSTYVREARKRLQSFSKKYGNP